MAMAMTMAMTMTAEPIRLPGSGRIDRRRMTMTVKASSCCGGSKENGSCSSSLSMPKLEYKAGLENVGKEFEALVAEKTLLELEKEYTTTEMKGSITKQDVRDAMRAAPSVAAAAGTAGETFVDVEELLAEAKDCDFIFDADAEDMVMV